MSLCLLTFNQSCLRILAICALCMAFLFCQQKFFFFFFLGPHLGHMEVPRLVVQLELQLLAYTTATATLDLSQVCDLHHSSWQHQIFNPLREAWDRTHNRVVPRQIHFCFAMMGTPTISFIFKA